MSSGSQVFKRIFKTLGWIAGGLIILLIVIIIAVRIPGVQNFIADKATKYIAGKTGTTVSLGNIYIGFPSTIIIRELFLDDLKGDTLIYASEIRADLQIPSLIRGELIFGDISLTSAITNIHRYEADSSFNFDFLAEAFASPPDTTITQDTAKPLTISLDEVALADVRLTFRDEITGINLNANVGNVILPVNEMDIDSMKFHTGEISIKNTNIDFIQSKKIPEDTADSSGMMPVMSMESLTMENSSFRMMNIPSSSGMNLKSGDVDISDAFIDLNTGRITAGEIRTDKTAFMMFDRGTEKLVSTSDNDQFSLTFPFYASIDNIDLKSSTLVMKSGQNPTPGSFNPSDINLAINRIKITPAIYDHGKIKADIKDISAYDHSGVSVKHLSAMIRMDSTAASVSAFNLAVMESSITGTFAARYESMDALINSPGKTIFAADLHKSLIYIQDIVTIDKSLLENEIIRKNRFRKLLVNLKAKGSVDNINIALFDITTGQGTYVSATGTITGLPDPDNLHLNLSIPQLTTTSYDLDTFIQLPENFRAPENIALSGKYKGSLNTFNYEIFAGTTRGSITSKGSVLNLDSELPGYLADGHIKDFDLGYIMKNDTLYGMADVRFNVEGRGTDPENMMTDFNIHADKITFMQYEYNMVDFKGRIENGVADVDGKIKDDNIDVDLEAIAGLTSDKEFYKANIRLNGADFKSLGFTTRELRASGTGEIDLSGYKINTLKGTAGVKDVLIIKNGKNYAIETFAFASFNEKDKKGVKIESTLLNANFDGNITIDETPKHLSNFFKKYFRSASDTVQVEGEQQFSFDIVVHNAPVISEVFVPGLESFIPGPVSGNFNSANSGLTVNIDIPQVIYSGIRIDSMKVNIGSDESKLNLIAGVSRLSVGSIELERTILQAVASENNIAANFGITSDDKIKLGIKANIQHGDELNYYKISITDGGIILNNEKWNIPENNYAIIGGAYPTFTNFTFTHEDEMIALSLPQGNKGIGISFRKFDIGLISEIIERDTSYVDGILNGNIDLIINEAGSGILANLAIDKLQFRSIPVGNVILTGETEQSSRYSVKMKLTGEGNNMTVDAIYDADTSNPSMDATLDIKNLSLRSVEPFTDGQLTRTTGFLNGRIEINGKMKEPEVNGNLKFNKAGFHLSYLNNYYRINEETIDLDEEGIYFDSFTITDSLDHTAILDGVVDTREFDNPVFSLDFTTDRFLAMNTQPVNNDLFFGTLLVSSSIKVRGDKNLPVVTANVKLLKGSSFTFLVPETKATTERGEDDVRFTDPYNRVNAILKKEMAADTFKAEITGFDISSNIEVTKESTLRIVVDQESGDSLVIKGDATMSFSIDPSGKTSLTGGFEISEGSYRVSVQNLVKKNFSIMKGSSINWRGDITDAEINIDAVNEVNASPLELVADQVSGLNENSLNAYRNRLPFLVILHMDGDLMSPEINFEISLPPEDQGVLNGTVFAKLTLLNQDPSELNKQVFALLVLNRFVQENPFRNETGGAINYVARNSVSKFLSQQLNTFAEQFIKGVELNFDVQSYEDYSTGEVEGRTEVNIGVTKRFLKDRLVVHVAGDVEVEGERASQNNASNLAGDIVIEYMITEDGRYRMRVFRTDQYEGVLDGEIKESGIGLLYTRDFDDWNQLFRKPEPQNTINRL